mgnify:CR=1 FL=1
MILAVPEDDLHNIEAHVVIIDGHDPYADRILIPLPLHQALPGLHHHGIQKHPNLH